MKTYIITQSILLIFSINIFAQNTNCNRAVWVKEDEKELPKEVCIPKGNYHVTQVYERVDINSDGLEDFIFNWNKNPLQDGDTLYVTIYTQNQDSIFSHFRTFSNLYPIYFKSYSFDYTPKNKKLRVLHKKYMRNPLIKLTFEKETIEIIRNGDAKENLIITYRYDKDIKNWRYEKTIMYDYALNTKEPYDLSEKLGPLIDNFTYFIWEEEEEE